MRNVPKFGRARDVHFIYWIALISILSGSSDGGRRIPDDESSCQTEGSDQGGTYHSPRRVLTYMPASSCGTALNSN